jgi:hypothetical protein
LESEKSEVAQAPNNASKTSCLIFVDQVTKLGNDWNHWMHFIHDAIMLL